MADETLEQTKQTDLTKGANPSVPDFEIRLNSYQVVGALGFVAVHNEIVFYEDGKPSIAFNGNAHDRRTGELETFTLGSNHTLRISSGNQTYEDFGMKKVGSVSLGKPDLEGVVEKLGNIVKAADWINSKNFDYSALGVVGQEAQNSNSAATALVTAMGYDYPEEAQKLWAPGAQRALLPFGWKAEEYYDDTFDIAETLMGLSRIHVAKSVRDENGTKLTKESGVPQAPDLRGSYSAAASGEVPPDKEARTVQLASAPQAEPTLSR